MCIRDSHAVVAPVIGRQVERFDGKERAVADVGDRWWTSCSCLLYTSDAADERSSVDLGGRRIIKKKKHEKNRGMGRNEHKN